jgi:hypothetical protein
MIKLKTASDGISWREKKNVSFDLNKIALDKQFLKAVVITSMLTDFLS